MVNQDVLVLMVCLVYLVGQDKKVLLGNTDRTVLKGFVETSDILITGLRE